MLCSLHDVFKVYITDKSKKSIKFGSRLIEEDTTSKNLTSGETSGESYLPQVVNHIIFWANGTLHDSLKKTERGKSQNSKSGAKIFG
jgi:hypothetical protein